jgi:Uma2 family endonuclease
MAIQPNAFLNSEEYLENERAATYKSEYCQGEVFAMARSDSNHNILTSNLIAIIGSCVRGKGYTVYPSDMRLHIPENGLYILRTG